MTKNSLIIVLASVLFSLCTAAVAAPSRVVVVIAGSCSIRDFADPRLPELGALLRSGSGALLNIRAGRPSKDAEPGSKSGFEMGCLSLGSSAMATGGAEIRRAGNAAGLIDNLSVREIYESRTAIDPHGAQVLHTEIARMQRINDAASYRAKCGSLGAALHAAGIKTAAIGNSDIPGEVHREAVAAVMDSSGIVDYGDVDGGANVADRRAPYGVRANPAAMLGQLDRLPKDCRFVVIDFGDTFRADSYAESCSDLQAAAVRLAADRRLSGFVGDLRGKLDPERDLLIVLSPNARSFTEIEGERMAAAIISGPGFGAGMLTSPSTRKPGVVTLADIAPTVLNFLGAKPSADMVGRPVVSLPGEDASSKLLAMNLAASGQAQRQVVMRWASVTQSVIVCLVLVAGLFVGSLRWKRAAAWLMLAVVAIPIAMLLLPLIYSGGAAITAALLVVITSVIIAVSAVAFRAPMRAFVWLCGAVVLAIMVDLLRGAPLMSVSVASYNIVEGARYYGIGNELMGTLLGAAMIGLGMALSGRRYSERFASISSLTLFAAVLFVVACPSMGAKVGGALTMTPAMIAAFLAMRGWRPSWRGVALVALGTLLVVAAMFASDSLRSGAAQSHAGRAAGMIASGDASGVLDIFARKLGVNFMLVVTSVWSRLLGLCVAGSAVLYWWGSREGDFLDRRESAVAIGCCVGTTAAFLFNDSGVVAAATCVVFLFAALALKALGKQLGK